MAFCEQCGAKLAPGMRFCEECGAAVGDGDETQDVNQSTSLFKTLTADDVCNPDVLTGIFSGGDWKESWKSVSEFAHAEEWCAGIILTRESAVLDDVQMSGEEFHGVVRDYIESALHRHDYIDSRTNRNVLFAYLDLDNCPFHNVASDAERIVAVLREISNVARPEYVFIIGRETVATPIYWQNEADDGDEMVPSDLCFATLCTESPWLARDFKFDEVLRVGRLPTYPHESVKSFKAYFDAATAAIGKIDDMRTYGLSAKAWEEESQEVFGKVSCTGPDISPPIVCQSAKGRVTAMQAGLLYFNLHGSQSTIYWYGQEGGNYPEAFEPGDLSDVRKPYFLGVEACYGAQYIGGYNSDISILISALENNCISFLGSSKIAYGTSSPTGSCADIVVGEFINRVADGHTSGDAYIMGLQELCKDVEAMDDADVKTLAEFALYGDPSACRNPCTCGFDDLTESVKTKPKTRKGISIAMPNVRQAIQMALADVDAKIEAIVDDYARRELFSDVSDSEFHSCKQKTFCVRDGLNQKLYQLKAGPVTRIAKVYFDQRGRVSKSLISK